jgi:hemoglobin-like flavoprotein
MLEARGDERVGRRVRPGRGRRREHNSQQRSDNPLHRSHANSLRPEPPRPPAAATRAPHGIHAIIRLAPDGVNLPDVSTASKRLFERGRAPADNSPAGGARLAMGRSPPYDRPVHPGESTMPDDSTSRIECSFGRLAPRGSELVDRFFAALFAEAPHLRSLFPANISVQKQKFLSAVSMVVKNIRKPDALREPLVEMGRRHVAYGAQPAHYPLVRDTFIEVMRDMSDGEWTDGLTSDWTAALNCVAAVMLEGHRIEEKAAVATR